MKHLQWILLLTCLCLHQVCTASNRSHEQSSSADYYRDYEVIRFHPRSPEHVKLLDTFVVANPNVDVLMRDRHSWTMLMSRDDIEAAKRRLPPRHLSLWNSMSHEVVVENVERTLQDEPRRNSEAQQHIRSRRNLDRSVAASHAHYRRYDEIKAWLEQKASSTRIASLVVLTQTHEQRAVMLIKIFTDNSKPIIWIDAGIHAREWIAPAAVLYFIDKLLEDSRESQSLLNQYQFYILPLVNPDGYEFTHTAARYWRKNRFPTIGTTCVGVDLNRNFPFKWSGPGSSFMPCSPIYRGVKNHSEAESQAMIQLAKSVQAKLHLVMSLHSFGQYIMMPFSYNTSTYTKSYYEMREVSERVATHMRHYHGRDYIVGSAADLTYSASGGWGDYAAAELKVPFVLTIEFPDKGRYGFLMPSSYIVSVGNQLWDMVKVYAKEL